VRPADPVKLPDCQMNWEWADGPISRGLVLAPARVGKPFSVGFSTVPNNGTKETNPLTVSHGLGRTPTHVFTQVPGGAYANVLSARPDNTSFTATTFVLRVESDAAIGFNVGVFWLALAV
jgi:hypothetical protein